MSSSFTHLHVHTEFSMLDGAARLDELVSKAVQDGQPALGITDHGNMYGVIDFYKECKKQGIKPIIGTEAYMAFDHRTERIARRGKMDDNGGADEGGRKQYYHLTLLAETNEGYRNLIKLSSLAFLEGYHYKPRIDWELLERHSKGLIATTGCLGGHVLQSLLNGDEKGAVAKAGRLQDIFGKDNLFVEIQDHGIADQLRTNPKLIEIANKIGAPLLATNDSHYVNQADHEAHDALLCVQTGALMRDQDRFRFEGNEHYLKSAEEMRYLWREQPTACDNSLWIAERSNVEIELGKYQLPVFPIPKEFASDEKYLEYLTWEGAKMRWGQDLPAEVVERVSYELGVIKQMGFNSYFLIVWDLIKHAKDEGIRVGPGRGSAAGCAVAYCLRITELDPLKYDLLFERFLNPSRVSMPDIDMDFDSRYRDHMIRYAAEKYGRDHVAQIITFATIKSRNAVRDAARVLGHEYAVGDRIAKLMPPLNQGRDTPLAACLEFNEKFADGYRDAQGLRDLIAIDEVAAKVVDVARGLEGLKRSDGIHAAAVVITPKELTEYLPIQRKPVGDLKADEAPIVTQYEMHGVEDLGLLKMDFLGLRNLDVITDAVEMIRRQRDPNFDIDTVPLDDKLTFELLGRGDTIGVFQLESPPMRALLKSMKPTTFEDVSAVLALYRPGPMSVNMHYDYADYKNNRKQPEYFHPEAKELLHDTYGLMVYQESMMRVAQKFAGYDLAQADNLRKACGKKDHKAMEKEEVVFVEGCEKTGYGRELGETLFGVIRKFADYAFNKSHTFGYGLISYQTAYLKAHFPVEYSASLLSSVKGNYEKAAVHLADCRSMGITVSNPDINAGRSDFEAIFNEQEKRIIFALSAVRNVGEGLVAQIVEERDVNGPYESFHDFAKRAPEQALNKRAVESLIKAGGFDSLGHPRRGLLMVFESIIDNAVAKRREEEKGVMSLFGELEESSDSGWSSEIAIPELQFAKPDQLRHEKDMLGLYISDHPLRGVENALRRLTTSSIRDLETREAGNVTIGGVMTSLNRRFTKRGDQMATFVIEDFDAAIEVTVFSKVLGEFGHLLADDIVVTVTGRLNKREDAPASFSAQRIVVPENLHTRIEEVLITLPTGFNSTKLDALKAIIADFPGVSPVRLQLAGGKVFDLGPGHLVDIEKAVAPLRLTFGSNAVKII
ncbi:MAG: DNA polymerase III subunit alpha [Actinobacteria bacterium]|nr:DNA polymerase III subunit alpha [Actinomycetota bacterium]